MTLPRHLFLALVALSSAYCLVYFDQTALNVALPTIIENLGGTVEQQRDYIHSYLLSLAAFVLPGYQLGTLLGQRRIYALGLILFMIASLLCTCAPSPSFFIASRYVQGVGAALILPISETLFAQNFDSNVQKRALGYFAALGLLALLLGPFLGGVLTEYISYRAIFILNIPLSLLALYLTSHYVKDYKMTEAKRGFDLLGSAALFASLYFFSYGKYLLALIALTLFFLFQWKLPTPLLNLQQLKKKTTLIGGLNLFAMHMAWISTFFFSLYMQSRLSVAPFTMGLLLLTAPIGALSILPLLSHFLQSIEAKWLILAGQGGLVCTFIYLFFFHTSPLLIAIGLCAMGAFLALLYLSNRTLIPSEATSFALWMRQLGSGVGFVLLSLIFTQFHFKATLLLNALSMLLPSLLMGLMIAKNSFDPVEEGVWR